MCFARLYPEYADICERHGVRLNTRADVSAAWRTAIHRVFELSSPTDLPAWAQLDEEAAGATHPLWRHAPIVAYFGFPVAVLLAVAPFF